MRRAVFGSSAPLCAPPLGDSPHPAGGPQVTDEPQSRFTSVREILACIDGSELGSGIVPHAQVIAQALGARLTLLHVLESEPCVGAPPPNPLDWGIRRQEARAHLEALAAPVVKLEHGVRSELIQGRPAEQICAWAEHHAVDLTVLCSHGVRGVTDWDLASTARKLIERTPGSLLMVPAAASVKGGEVRYRRILVPVDGSPRAESVIPIAVRIAASQSAELLFVYVIPIPEITRTGAIDEEGAELERRVIEHNRRVASAYLDRLRARISHADLGVRTVVVGDGNTRSDFQHLIREEEVDLVVMSAHGHKDRTDTACGRLTEYALTHATTPLLVVRDRSLRRVHGVGPLKARPSERFATPSQTKP